ncbi:MAG TPA: DUF2007 domain-containing protein [Gaiellaceae bacterium]|nr:DUF2007 domain-containing protein [Gaiellaceae bacterium]
MADPGGVKLTVVTDRMAAEILCGMLRTNGIKCGYALTDRAAATAMGMGGTSNVGPVEVFVEEDQLDVARRLLPPD